MSWLVSQARALSKLCWVVLTERPCAIQHKRPDPTRRGLHSENLNAPAGFSQILIPLPQYLIPLPSLPRDFYAVIRRMFTVTIPVQNSSTCQMAVTPCACGVKAGMVRVCVADKTVWSSFYTLSIFEHFRDVAWQSAIHIHVTSLFSAA